MRVPLATTLASRDGGVTKDAKCLNALVEVRGEEDFRLRKRPGNQDAGLIKAGIAQALTYWNSLLVTVQADYLNYGTLSTAGTWNANDKGATITLSGSNLIATDGAGGNDAVRSGVSKSSGKWYWELLAGAVRTFQVGVANASATLDNTLLQAGGNALMVNFNGSILLSDGAGGTVVGSIGAFVTGDRISIALDMDARTVAFRLNNGAATTISGVNVPTGDLYAIFAGTGNAGTPSATANFGATAQTYSPPSGYTAGLTFSVVSFSSSVSTALSPSTASLPFSMQDNGSNAPKLYLMLKNASQAWTLDSGGTLAAISDVDYPGTYAVTLTSLTRSSTTATATTATDTNFQVGSAVTIAGATPSDYNGAKTILSVSSSSSESTPPVEVTITRSSTTVTATTVDEPHGYTNGQSVTISGAIQAAYNGTFTIAFVSATVFTFTVTVTGGVTSPATGTLVAAISMGNRDCTITIISGTATVTWAEHGLETGAKVVVQYFSGGSLLQAVGSSITVATANTFTFATANGNVTGVRGFAYQMLPGTVSSITASGFTATVTMSVAHHITRFNSVSISGAAQADYNRSSVIATVTGSTSFTYPLEQDAGTDPATPATGTITAQINTAVGASFTFTIAGSPATPATGTITATGGRNTVPGIAYIDGYFAVMDVNGVIYNSAEDDPSAWNALEYVTALAESGVGKCLAQSGRHLIAFKEWSTEPFFNAGNATGSPFSPDQGANSAVGCASGFSVAEIAGVLVWIAQEKKVKGRSVYMMVGTAQQKISTEDVDRILDADDLATVYAYGFKIGGHPVYVLSLVTSNITLVCDLTTKTWTQWSSLTLGSSASISSITRSGTTATVTFGAAHGLSDGDPFKISGATQTEYNGIFQARYSSTTVVTIEVTGSPATPATGTILGYPYTESYFKFTKYCAANGQDYGLHVSDGHLYQVLASLYQDAGIPINVFARSSRMDGGDVRRKKLARIGVIGDSVSDTAMIRWSDDDSSTFSAYRIVTLSDREPMLRRCGAFQRRSFEYRHIGNTAPTLSALELEVSK